MVETKPQARRGGFRGFEKRVHELEETDRAEEREREANAGTDADELEATVAEIRPPPAHDE